MAFPGVDFIGIDALLSEQEREIRDTVRAFVDEQFMPAEGRGRTQRAPFRRPLRRDRAAHLVKSLTRRTAKN